MAQQNFELPDIGEGIAEGELVNWLVDPGDRVAQDEPLAEVETDKALVEVPSPYDGTITALEAEAGEMVPVGEVIVTFEVDDRAEATAESQREPPASDTESTPSHTDTDPEEESGQEPEVGDGRVFAPPRVRQLAREKGVEITAVQESSTGSRVTETDVLAAAGSTADRAAEESEDRDTTAAQTADATVGAERDSSLAMPATRRLARENGIDLNDVPASERKNGEPFVTPEDLEAYLDDPPGRPERGTPDSNGTSTGQSDRAKASAPSSRTADEGGQNPGDRVPYKGIRRTIGERMATSKFTAPHVSHHDEVDVTPLVELREQLRDTASDDGVRLTYMPFVIKAVTAALRSHPYLNAELDEEAGEILLHDEYHIGIAVATDAGLMVPVIENADQKGLLELATEVADLAERARSRSISPSELEGSTFTITNVGAIGGEYSSPIINYPESGILALGEIKTKPAVHDDEITKRELMTISMSVDHRIVDGAEAAQFTNEVKRYLNEPKRLLLE
ncbi:2-oxo acid dehydrogenase subunit E2 [Halobellus ordinarius]|uniref:2-oxo acid dehydrogenase subunit E2 n=1 Tax=Halobellus ordinarius TaxID=3075120 RepID=UPI0028808218|nr:2-oxo acid dehydrogenase subunit E2 [Halobellus sp. ZY16]